MALLSIEARWRFSVEANIKSKKLSPFEKMAVKKHGGVPIRAPDKSGYQG